MKAEIRGEIFIPDYIALADCTIHVRLLDTSYADAPAKIINELNISYSAKKYAQQIPFILRVTEKLHPQNEYSLEVHADLDGDGEISTKDLIQNRSYPVRINENSTDDFKIQLLEIS